MNQLTTSLWGDESFTAVAVQENFGRMLEIVAKDTAPPLYYILLFIWARIFGSSETAIRSLSVLLYLGTVFVVYLIAKKVWNKKTGLLAILLTLANPFLFPFAFEGRMYAILVFFVTLSFYFFISKNNLGYILASVAALYSHHYAVLALIFQFFWRLVEVVIVYFNSRSNKDDPCIHKDHPLRKFIKPYFIIGLLYLPWLYPLYKQVTLVSTGFWLAKPKLKNLIGIFTIYLVGGDIIFKWQKYWPILAGFILILKKWSIKKRENLFLIGWILTPVILAFFLSQGKTSIFYDRYLIFIIPGLTLLLAGSWKKISLSLILLFSLPFFWVNYHYFTHSIKWGKERPFRELAEYVKKEVEENDFLINYNGDAHHLWESKYYGLEAPLYVPEGKLVYFVGTAQMTEKDIIKQLPDKKRVGVVSSEDPNSMEILNCQLKNYQQFGSLYFSWFEQQ